MNICAQNAEVPTKESKPLHRHPRGHLWYMAYDHTYDDDSAGYFCYARYYMLAASHAGVGTLPAPGTYTLALLADGKPLPSVG